VAGPIIALLAPRVPPFRRWHRVPLVVLAPRTGGPGSGHGLRL